MAKRRNKNKARRALAGLNRKLNSNGDYLNKIAKMDENCESSSCDEKKTDDPEVTVQVTENGKIDFDATEKGTDQEERKEDVTGDKNSAKKNFEKKRTPRSPKSSGDGNPNDEVLIFPTEMDGETCIDIQCGGNEAFMYLGKLCVGSRGACIKFADGWLTPNEFQLVSGRETAKDWKRSIRHRGRSLKLLISKGLVTIHPASPKKPKSDDDEKKKKKTKRADKGSAASDGNVKPAEQNSAAIAPVVESHEPQPQPKKRGRKPKRLRGRRPKEPVGQDTDGMTQVGDKACKDPDMVHTTSDSVGRARDESETDVDGVTESADNREAVADPAPPPADTRTDEERRLDEFVKSLRLTKTTVQPPSALAPKLVSEETSANDVVKNIGISDVIEAEEPIDVDPEMPILHKESAIAPHYEQVHSDISVSVEALNATVTPPPTPPSERLGIDQKLNDVTDAKLVETFKSTLASPSVGLKLTINRAKVKREHEVDDLVSKDHDDSDKSGDVKKEPTDTKKSENVVTTNVPSLLLQDALQSAKKYKEQLQQSKTSPVKVPQMKMPPPSAERPKTVTSITSPTFMPSVKRENDNKVHRYSINGSSKVPATTRLDKSTSGDGADKLQMPLSLNGGQMPSLEDMRKLSAMSFKDFMSVMTSIYGPLPFPFDNKDATFAALKDLQQKHDMLRLLTQQCQGQGSAGEHAASPSSSSLLYPMITQQLLLAMTQQLYSMCNIPGTPINGNPKLPVSPGTNNFQKRESHHSNKMQNVTSSNDANAIHSRRPEDAARSVHRHAEKSYQRNVPMENHRRTLTHGLNHVSHSDDSANRKRKHIEVDSNGALDLSMKRPRTDIVAPSKPRNVQNNDGPLDFSMKRLYPDQHNSKVIASTNGFNSAFHSSKNYNYSQKQTPSQNYSAHLNGYSKPGSRGCTCRVDGSDDIANWSVEQVCYFLKTLDGCASYAKTFHDQGISGRVLPFLTTQHLTRTLGMKVGPALTLIQAVERKRASRHATSTASVTSPCIECRSRYNASVPMQIRT